MMNCISADACVEAWAEGTMTHEAFEEFQAHLTACRDCSRRFGAYLPLMERDAGIQTHASHATPATTAASAFSSRVMAEINTVHHHRFLSPMLAAAAAAIFITGLSFGIFFTKLNSNTVTVQFVLSAPQAHTVALAGNFNNWNTAEYTLKRSASGGSWEIRIPLEKGKVYVYNFVVDGTEWITDPGVPARIDDGFGGTGSLLRL